jgi:hypothetical protein
MRKEGKGSGIFYRQPKPSVNDSLPLAIRLFGALGGLLGGGLLGVLLLVFSMIFTDSTFGLSTILPGALVGAGVGAVLGFCFPRVGKMLAGLFSNL